MQTKFHQYLNYTAHPHDMVHIPAKFRENISMRFRVTVRKQNVMERWTDRRTDRWTGGHCNISRPLAYGAAGDKNTSIEE